MELEKKIEHGLIRLVQIRPKKGFEADVLTMTSSLESKGLNIHRRVRDGSAAFVKKMSNQIFL